MKLSVYQEANKIWSRVAKEGNANELKFNLEIHKVLLNFFQVGDYYYYIFNLKTSSFELVSKEIKDVLGYEPEEVTIPFFIDKIHPEDQPWFLNFENKASEFLSPLSQEEILNYKIRYDYRVRKKNGDYIRILQQVLTIQFGDDNGVLRTFGVHTDISHLKPDGHPVLSFIGLNGHPSYIGVEAEEVFTPASTLLTKREREVLALLIQGKKSEEISKVLYISKQTVDTHRKNLLKKTNCLNTASLTSMAVRKGWV